jgi:hypothetical protein
VRYQGLARGKHNGRSSISSAHIRAGAPHRFLEQGNPYNTVLMVQSFFEHSRFVVLPQAEPGNAGVSALKRSNVAADSLQDRRDPTAKGPMASDPTTRCRSVPHSTLALTRETGQGQFSGSAWS